MRVALLHNPRPEDAPAGLPDDMFEEFDSTETIDAIADALRSPGVEVVPIIADRALPQRLDDGRFDFAFNIAEGSGRRNREAVPAAVCELLGLPYTGSDPLTLALTLDKWMARRVVSPDVPVARAALWLQPADDSHLNALTYPAIVKPNDEGSSKGIREDSIVESAAAAASRARMLHETYGCPVLVEQFLPGAEITIGLLGNGDTARVIALMEIEPIDCSPRFVYSVEVKRDFLRRVRYHVPPRVAPASGDELARLAIHAFHCLGCRDVARVDFRLDALGRPHFLECNPLPGLNPSVSDLVILSRGVLTYSCLVRQILKEATARTGVQMP